MLAGALAAKAQYPQQFISVRGIAPTGSVNFQPTAAGSSTTQTVQFTIATGSVAINSITVPQSLGGKQEFVVGMVSGCVVDGKTNNAIGTVCTVPVTLLRRMRVYAASRW